MTTAPADAATIALARAARRLRDATEPLAASVYFAPECHEAYHRLGFDPSPGVANGVALPDGPAYFTSRAACLGRVPGHVVTAAFGVFNPDVVVPAVAHGWSLVEPDAILAARLEGQRAQLERLLGGRATPAGVARATELLRRAGEALPLSGRHLHAGLRSLGFPGDPWGDLWRAADLVREGRGDSHIAAWVAAGLDPVEVSVLTELWWGLPHKTYSRSRGWTDAHLDAAAERLRAQGMLDGGGGVALTDPGLALRRRVEVATDRQDEPMVAAIGADLDELLALLEPWAEAICSGGGYPARAFRTAADLDG
jgi:hypothetical protein